MRTKLDLREYQLQAIDRVIRDERTAIFLQPGDGKTAIALYSLLNLGLPKTLVLAPPKVVTENVWGEECQQWEELKDVSVIPLTGAPQARLNKIKGKPHNLYTLSYNLVPWLMSIKGLLQQFDAIVFDELSFMKSAGAKRFRALRSHLKRFDIRIGLTGSPTGNSLLNLWSEMWCIADHRPLGPTLGQYKYQYFLQVSDYVWKIKETADADIKNRITPYAFSVDNPYRKEDTIVHNHIQSSLPKKAAKVYENIQKDFFHEFSETERIEIFNPLTVAGKLRQVCSGNVYDEFGEVIHVHKQKIEMLSDLVEELQGQPLLVFYQFKFEAELIAETFGDKAVHINEKNAVARWSQKEILLLYAHPQSAGHGLNLQFGSNHLCWFTLTWSNELFWQAIGRLDRTGQPENNVYVHYLLIKKTIDEAVLQSLIENKSVEDSVIDYVKLQHAE